MLTEKDKTFDVYTFLFSDILLFTRLKKDIKKSRGVSTHIVRLLNTHKGVGSTNKYLDLQHILFMEMR